MGVKFFDYDNDGRPDLFITDMHSDMSVEVGPDREKLKSRMEWTKEFLQGDETKYVFGNSLFHNLGGGRFAEESDRMNVENYWPWGPSVGDLNADGWQDIFIASSMNRSSPRDCAPTPRSPSPNHAEPQASTTKDTKNTKKVYVDYPCCCGTTR